jgi:hypothetical protein
VFSKCKDNLENGRRLENMSWRLWYRESTLKETAAQQPIPIPTTQRAKANEKPLTPASFTKIISSLNENELIVSQRPTLIMTEMPKPNLITTEKQLLPPRNSKFFIKEEDESDFDDESDWSSDDEYAEEKCVLAKEEQDVLFASTFRDNTRQEVYVDENDDDYETVNDDDDDDNYETVDEDAEDDRNKIDDMAFLLEFKKRSPSSMRPKGHSLLSNMLRAQVPPDYASKSSSCYL